MEIEPNPGYQIPVPAFDPNKIPRVPASHPPDYDPWEDDHRDYRELYPQEEPIQNLVAPYPNLDPLDPYWDNDQYMREILENPYPYEEPMPQYPDPIPAPAPPMSTENVQELRTFGEELLDECERIRSSMEKKSKNVTFILKSRDEGSLRMSNATDAKEDEYLNVKQKDQRWKKRKRVTPNMYGNLVANAAAGIAGSTGVMPGGNVGTEYAIFEQGASAGNVGKPSMVEKKRAHPVALLLSSAMMMRYLQLPNYADRL
ncbi:uncharacterized protein LOC110888353 [Helianthus annuus]|uniref:uncharacterized protein LOC110888353 n=1 Tax=Helianthus annuus TaxID=4232 RepID=UPI000B907974|nr:uncharacterized protein LOC110888353 [Helianthus annuus]